LRIATGECGTLTSNPGKAIIILEAGGEKCLNNVAGDRLFCPIVRLENGVSPNILIVRFNRSIIFIQGGEKRYAQIRTRSGD
jgi:hypothetical protein